jgi:hypothetical protein
MIRFTLVTGFAGILLLAAVSASHAEAPAASAVTIVEGPGVKIGEGTVLRPILGVETGVISNVFREEDGGATSGILRLIGEIGVGSLSPQRLEMAQGPLSARNGSEEEQAVTTPDPGDLEFRADLGLTYDEYLTTNNNVRTQRDLAVIAGLRAIVFPLGTWAFAFDNQFTRETRPTNFESRSNTNRDINSLRLQLLFQPRQRTLSAGLRFENRIDVFETDEQAFANRLQNTLGMRVNWQFLPVTRFYADASIGFFSGLGDSEKISSTPLRLLLGAQSAITVKTTVNTRIGFGKSFYSSGPDFTNVLLGADIGYRYSPVGRVTFLYDFDFGDSVNANFYRDHVFKSTFEQQFAPFLVQGSAEVRFRGYRGVLGNLIGPSTDRDDLIFALGLGGHYNFRDWFAATVNYNLVSDQTDFVYMTIDGYSDDPSFTRQELLVGVRAAL